MPTEKGLPLYSAYMSHLYETDVRIAYAPGMDEFSAVCDRKNIKIWDEFCVKGYYRHYDGMSLLKHALHNTCPDLMKCIGEDENGNDIKVRDATLLGRAALSETEEKAKMLIASIPCK